MTFLMAYKLSSTKDFGAFLLSIRSTHFGSFNKVLSRILLNTQTSGTAKFVCAGVISRPFCNNRRPVIFGDKAFTSFSI